MGLKGIKVGQRDFAGRVLRVVRDCYVFTRSRQAHPVGICWEPECKWRRDGLNAMATGAVHAATKGHVVTVTREMVTEYDGKTAMNWPLDT